MIEYGHDLALEEATKRVRVASVSGDTENALIAGRQMEAVSRIQQATEVILIDLKVPDISLPPNQVPKELQEATFSESVRYFLRERDTNMRQFSGMAGTSESHMSKILSKERDPGLLSFSRIINGFGWTIDNWEAQLLFRKAVAHLEPDQSPNP